MVTPDLNRLRERVRGGKAHKPPQPQALNQHLALFIFQHQRPIMVAIYALCVMLGILHGLTHPKSGVAIGLLGGLVYGAFIAGAFIKLSQKHAIATLAATALATTLFLVECLS